MSLSQLIGISSEPFLIIYLIKNSTNFKKENIWVVLPIIFFSVQLTLFQTDSFLYNFIGIVAFRILLFVVLIISLFPVNLNTSLMLATIYYLVTNPIRRIISIIIGFCGINISFGNMIWLQKIETLFIPLAHFCVIYFFKKIFSVKHITENKTGYQVLYFSLLTLYIY